MPTLVRAVRPDGNCLTLHHHQADSGHGMTSWHVLQNGQSYTSKFLEVG